MSKITVLGSYTRTPLPATWELKWERIMHAHVAAGLTLADAVAAATRETDAAMTAARGVR